METSSNKLGTRSPCLAGHALFRHHGYDPATCPSRAAPKNDAAHKAQNQRLIRWSIQEIRRMVTLPACTSAAARHAYQKSKVQL